METNAQRSFALSAMLALTAVSLSGCVTAKMIDNAQPHTE
jgi:hypothetical protein